MHVVQTVLALLIGLIVLVGTLGGGGVLLAHHGPAVWEGWASRAWPATAARVTRSETIQKASPALGTRGGTGSHAVVVRYSYQVDGRRYEGHRLGLDDEGKIFSEENARRSANRWPVGLATTARYDPADPARSLLIPGVPTGGVLGVLFGLALVAAGVAPLVLAMKLRTAWALRRSRAAARDGRAPPGR